ncbi:hypothetical protein M7I_0715 [Glarea lozoyensis 74030]|nr:hypothetical protein M7I_0715 [Glarea lozoyensis 74030]
MNGVESGSAERPPLVGRYPRIVPYSARNGSPGSAISLTEKLVWEMNTVFRCENKIRHFQVKIEEIDDTHDKVSDMIEKIKSHIDNLEAGEDLSPHEKNLQTMYDTVADLQGERIEWLEKIELAREELSMPKEGMYRDLEFLLAKNNLLEDISGNDPDHLPWNADVPAAAPEQVEAPEKTPSQIAHETLEIQQWQARDTKGRMEGLLRAARDRVANWHEVYEAKLKDYNELVDAGVDLDTTRTEFDVLLLQEEIEATQDLGRAELDYKVAIHDAQQLGVIFKDEEQDSDFLEQFRAQENDGYRLSIEHDLIDHVDSHRIEKWMGMTSDGEPAAPACDDWDFKSIGFGEGVSVIAEGFSRKRIDHWRCVCEDTQRHMDDNISREHDDLYEEDDRHFHNGEQ